MVNLHYPRYPICNNVPNLTFYISSKSYVTLDTEHSMSVFYNVILIKLPHMSLDPRWCNQHTQNYFGWPFDVQLDETSFDIHYSEQ